MASPLSPTSLTHTSRPPAALAPVPLSQGDLSQPRKKDRKNRKLGPGGGAGFGVLRRPRPAPGDGEKRSRIKKSKKRKLKKADRGDRLPPPGPPRAPPSDTDSEEEEEEEEEEDDEEEMTVGVESQPLCSQHPLRPPGPLLQCTLKVLPLLTVKAKMWAAQKQAKMEMLAPVKARCGSWMRTSW